MKEHMENMLSVIGSTVAVWMKGNSEEVLARKVIAQLDSKQEEVVCKLLGFNDRWGKWEVDSCNGRAGNSAAGDYLRSVQKDAIEKWFKSVKLPPMSAAVTKSLKTTYLSNLEYQLKESLRRKAEAQAAAIADKMVEQCLSDEGATDNYFKLLALLEQTNTKQT